MADSHREEIAKLEALYAANPGGRVFVHLAEAYRKAGEHERARRILDEGLARHTDSASGYVVLGRVLADMQIADEAAAAFRRVLELDSGNLVALRWLGDLARQSGRNHEAVAHYRELLARNPSNEEVRDLVEIVEREAVAAPRGQDALDDALEPEWNEPVEEPAPQVDDSGDALTPLSAAPGQTGDIEPADMELTIVELALEEPGEEERAVQHAPADDLRYADDLSATHDPHDVAPLEQSLEIMGSFESAQPDAVDSELVESRHAIDDDDVAELGALTRSDEADALDIHLLDPAWSGDEPEGGEFADDDFLADLTMGAGEEHEPDELTVDRVDLMGTGTPLTLQSEPAAGAEEPAALADETGASQDEPAALA